MGYRPDYFVQSLSKDVRQLTVGFTLQVYEQIDDAAKRANISRAEFVRALVVRALSEESAE